MTPTPHLSAQQKPAFSEMRIPLFVHLALIAGAYFASVRLGLLFVVQPEGIASIWPPSGVALAALLLSDRRKWIYILLVILIVNVAGNLTGGNTLSVSLGFGLVNALEAGLSAIVITRILGYSISFSRAFEVIIFFGVIGVCNAFTAFLGAAVPALAFGAPFFETWVVWWISDTLGMILITPFILTMATNPSLISSTRSYKAYIERIVLLTAIVLVTWFLSSGISHSLFNFYMIFPLLMWSAFRFGLRGTASATLLFTFVALGMIVYANSGLGITRVSVTESLLSMQILVSIIALSSMTLAAVLSEQKQTHQRLGLLAEMVDIAPNSILVHDLDGRILYANQRSFDMHGYDEQGFMALNLHDIDIPESEQLIATRMKQIAEKGEANFEAAHYRKDGAIIPLLAHVKQTQWAGLPALLSISSDITERKTAEEKFNQQSIQRQRLLEMGRQLTSSLDIDSVLKDISAEVRNLLGASGVTIYMLDEQGNKLIPVLSHDPLYEDQVMSVKLDIDNCLTGKVIKAKQGMIFNYADQQPEEYHIPGTAIDEEHLIIAPFIINEKAIGSLNIYRSSATFNEDDLALAETFTLYASTAINNARTHQELLDQIATRKQAEEALAQSDSLRELLLDIITHDLRNPAGNIYALSEAARQNMPENKFLEGIYTSSGRLIEVLTQTTTLSQAAFDETIPKESLSLNTLLQETADEFATALNTAEMELVIAIAPDVSIEANPLIAEVFKNYISNAIKYARDGKRIVIETVLEDQTVMVSVKDFGKTLPEADREQVFERQVQLENGKERGRGLGLAIVKRIALAHDGEVWVEPNTPEGNSFCLRIPL